MKLVKDFFNKLAVELDKIYFPEVKYYRDNEDCTKVHYAIELFNNGCLTYDDFIANFFFPKYIIFYLIR